jgi:hypothetical protein
LSPTILKELVGDPESLSIDSTLLSVLHPSQVCVDRATVYRYCKRLDKRSTLELDEAPGKRPNLDEKASKLLVEDLRKRPWALPILGGRSSC